MATIGPLRGKSGKLLSDSGFLALFDVLGSTLRPDDRPAVSERLRQVSARALRWRRLQRSIFPEAALRESCWDLLLLCFVNQLDGRFMCVKQLRNELGETGTSLLRRVEELEQADLVRRERDDVDGRRTIVRLTRDGAMAMSRFFTAVAEETPR